MCVYPGLFVNSTCIQHLVESSMSGAHFFPWGRSYLGKVLKCQTSQVLRSPIELACSLYWQTILNLACSPTFHLLECWPQSHLFTVTFPHTFIKLCQTFEDISPVMAPWQMNVLVRFRSPSCVLLWAQDWHSMCSQICTWKCILIESWQCLCRYVYVCWNIPPSWPSPSCIYS